MHHVDTNLIPSFLFLTTLLQEFEEWLRKAWDNSDIGDVSYTLHMAIEKLEELKKKHNINSSNQ